MRQCLSLLLTALIVLQSVVAVADAHVSHQDGIEHVVLESAPVLAEADAHAAPASSTDMLDCQHCCHCHGMTPLVLASEAHFACFAARDKGCSLYHFDYPSIASSPGLRPPIA